LIYLKKIRAARRSDLAQVIAIDAGITGLRKPVYWSGILARYGSRRRQRYFLVAENERAVQGYIVGEVRDWEFGSPPCGWVFGLGVRPEARLAGVGARMFEAICDRFRHDGVTAVRPLLDRNDPRVLACCRSQGMTAAPVIPLQMELE